MKYKILPKNNEFIMKESDLIISKTDLKGYITYANRCFMEFALYSEQELIGKPHNIIRHPDMPRAVFKLLWDRIQNGKEIFAYVKNLASEGSFYWVYANIAPVYDLNNKLINYMSVRRYPNRNAISFFAQIYKEMCSIEKRVGGNKGMEASMAYLQELLRKENISYDEFVQNCQFMKKSA